MDDIDPVPVDSITNPSFWSGDLAQLGILPRSVSDDSHGRASGRSKNKSKDGGRLASSEKWLKCFAKTGVLTPLKQKVIWTVWVPGSSALGRTRRNRNAVTNGDGVFER